MPPRRFVRFFAFPAGKLLPLGKSCTSTNNKSIGFVVRRPRAVVRFPSPFLLKNCSRSGKATPLRSNNNNIGFVALGVSGPARREAAPARGKPTPLRSKHAT